MTQLTAALRGDGARMVLGVDEFSDEFVVNKSCFLLKRLHIKKRKQT